MGIGTEMLMANFRNSVDVCGNPLPQLKCPPNNKKRLGTILFDDADSVKINVRKTRSKNNTTSRGSTAFTFIEMANRKETSNI